MSVDVTVIMPVYNKAEYIDDAIKSVLQQSGVSVELVCVDDGSTDDSLGRINSYCDNNNVIVCSQENSGAGAARNKGISLARGKYLSFLDPDDWYPEKNSLHALVESAETYHVKISMGRRFYYVSPFTLSRKDNVFKEGLHSCAEIGSAFLYQSCIFQKQFVNDYDLKFPDYLRFEDPPFFMKAIKLTESFSFVNTRVHCYRRGIQRINWTLDKLCGYLLGVKDCLNIALDIDNKAAFAQVAASLNHSSFCQGIVDLNSEEINIELRHLEKFIILHGDQSGFRLRALQLIDETSSVKSFLEYLRIGCENKIKGMF